MKGIFHYLPPLGTIEWVCYPVHIHTNHWGRLKWPYAIARMTAHFMCGLMSDLMIGNFRRKKMYGHTYVQDTECSHWDQVSLTQHKPNATHWLRTTLEQTKELSEKNGWLSYFLSQNDFIANIFLMGKNWKPSSFRYVILWAFFEEYCMEAWDVSSRRLVDRGR